MPSEATRAPGLGVALWGAAALGALAVGVVSGWAAGLAIDALAGPVDGVSTSLAALAFSIVVFGWLPLAVVVPALFVAARSGERFRLRALGLTMAVASGLGFLALGVDRRPVQVWLVAWLVFALLVPRPPVRQRTGAEHQR